MKLTTHNWELEPFYKGKDCVLVAYVREL